MFSSLVSLLVTVVLRKQTALSVLKDAAPAKARVSYRTLSGLDKKVANTSKAEEEIPE